MAEWLGLCGMAAWQACEHLRDEVEKSVQDKWLQLSQRASWISCAAPSPSPTLLLPLPSPRRSFEECTKAMMGEIVEVTQRGATAVIAAVTSDRRQESDLIACCLP